jgi:protein-S-isoprenylcysteine O-methyltransferase Ste14
MLAGILLSMLVFVKFKSWWKNLNLSIYVAYISFSLYNIYSDPIYIGFAAMVLAIILMLIHLGILLISIIFLYKIFVIEKEWR